MCSVERISSGSAFHRVVLCMSACYIYPTREVTPLPQHPVTALSPCRRLITLQPASPGMRDSSFKSRILFIVAIQPSTLSCNLQGTHPYLFLQCVGMHECACVYMREYMCMCEYMCMVCFCMCVSVSVYSERIVTCTSYEPAGPGDTALYKCW